MDRPLWQPDERQIADANMTAFIRKAADRFHLELNSYADLYRWSIESPEQFWPEVWDFCGIISEKRWDAVLLNGNQMPGSTWFSGTRLNFARNLLRCSDDHPAIIFHNEAGMRREVTYSELNAEVVLLAAALRSIGVQNGDRIAAFMPNIPEAVAGMLASVSLGAVWSSCSPDFGAQGVIDRFGQIKPRVLFAADGYYYNGSNVSSLPRISLITEQLPSLEKTVIIPYSTSAPEIGSIPNSILMDDFLAAAPPGPPEFASLPFDHPLYVMYSSGTTGLPKSIVHGAGGTLIQHLKELVLHTDLKRQDKIFYFTTCGWMMWNWLITSLAVGATLILYDGSPSYPDLGVLFEIAEKEKMTVFGTSAKYISALEKAGMEPALNYNLTSLRTILSTGSPLVPESFDYVYGSIKKNVCLSSISGGTDIISCFALGNPIGAVWRGELQTRGLGMSAKIFSQDGKEIRGEKGELVCTRPFPSMPISFWNDDDGSRYHDAYFSRYPNIWHHGDFAELTAHDGLIIHGRSDTVLNPGGVRIGTAEIYRIVGGIQRIEECICVGQDWGSDTRIVLFVKLDEGIQLDRELKSEILQRIRSGASPRHVPAKILQVADIPRTLNGKISEMAVREIIHGREVGNRDALANPECLDLFKDIPDLRH